MATSRNELLRRTKDLALSAIKLDLMLPRTRIADALGKQLVLTATQVGAEYRTIGRCRTLDDESAKLALVLQEVERTGYWLELLVESGSVSSARASEVVTVVNDVSAMTTRSLQANNARAELGL
jgi:hypothetical protein